VAVLRQWLLLTPDQAYRASLLQVKLAA